MVRPADGRPPVPASGRPAGLAQAARRARWDRLGRQASSARPGAPRDALDSAGGRRRGLPGHSAGPQVDSACLSRLPLEAPGSRTYGALTRSGRSLEVPVRDSEGSRDRARQHGLGGSRLPRFRRRRRDGGGGLRRQSRRPGVGNPKAATVAAAALHVIRPDTIDDPASGSPVRFSWLQPGADDRVVRRRDPVGCHPVCRWRPSLTSAAAISRRQSAPAMPPLYRPADEGNPSVLQPIEILRAGEAAAIEKPPRGADAQGLSAHPRTEESNRDSPAGAVPGIPRYSVVLPAKCSLAARASALVACTVPSACSGGPYSV